MKRDAPICSVIPAYRAAQTICGVVSQVLKFVDIVIVVDDACPESTGEVVKSRFADIASVIVISHKMNCGVGGATKTGIAAALRLNASFIVKIDADGQMDPFHIERIVDIFENNPAIDLVKGSRFTNLEVLRVMPKIRLFGNSILTLLVKFSSGYWNLLDPTNGYLAFRASSLHNYSLEKFSDRYFFEISVLCAFGLQRDKVAELDMPAIYGGEKSSLSILKVIAEFPFKLFWLYVKRILVQYYLLDINIASMYILFGLILMFSGVGFGIFEWGRSISTNTPRTTGTVMLATIPILMGFQLLLNALMFDMQFGSRIERFRSLSRG